MGAAPKKTRRRVNHASPVSTAHGAEVSLSHQTRRIAMTHRKRAPDEPHECSKACAPRPGDERGVWSRKQLERMDDRFVRAVQREERKPFRPGFLRAVQLDRRHD